MTAGRHMLLIGLLTLAGYSAIASADAVEDAETEPVEAVPEVDVSIRAIPAEGGSRSNTVEGKPA